MQGQMHNQAAGQWPSKGDKMNLVYFVARGLATLVTPITRKGFGKEGLGLYALVAMIGLLYAAAANRDQWLWWYFGLWMFAVVYQRACTFKNKEPVHSAYGGFPELASKLFRQAKENYAKILEVFLVMGAAVAASDFSPVLGRLLFASMAGLVIVRAIEYQVNRTRITRMQDSQIEYSVMQQYWRDGRNDW